MSDSQDLPLSKLKGKQAKVGRVEEHLKHMKTIMRNLACEEMESVRDTEGHPRPDFSILNQSLEDFHNLVIANKLANLDPGYLHIRANMDSNIEEL